MQATTAVTRAAQTRPATRPRSLAVLAGGADALDAALTDAVGPAVEQLAPARWSFLRWSGDDGPCVRLELETGDEEAREIARFVEDRLVPGAAPTIPAPLLPRPASWRGSGGAVGVRRRACDEDLLEPLHQLSSEVVLRALPELPDGRTRCALGMALMATTARAALDGAAAADLWRDGARRLTGGDERLLASLARKAGELGEELVRVARGLRREGASAGALERWGDGCRELAGASAVGRHAHLVCNRLGVTPLEEALLGLVLAGAGGRDGRRRAVGEAHGAGEAGEAREAPPAPADGACDTSSGAAHDERGRGPVVLTLDEVSKPGVLKGVSFTVHEGEVLALVGPQGAGKSTLLGIAAGLRMASGGSVRVLDRDPRAARREHAPGAELAMPDAELADEATVRESVELHSRASEADAAGIVDGVLEATGLHDEAATPVGELGAGARRRTAIACAVVQDPAVLLLDEPTAGLSAVERDEVWRVVGNRRERGATTVVATGSIQEATCIGDRAGLLIGGRLESLGTPEAIAGEFFPERSLRFHVTEKPDRALLADLPDVAGVEVDERVDHWAVEVATRQPRELLALLEADPEFPELLNVDDEHARRPVRGDAGMTADDANRELELARLAVKGLLERVEELSRSVDEAQRAIETSSAELVSRFERSAEPLVAALRERAESLGLEADLMASGLAARTSEPSSTEEPQPEGGSGAKREHTSRFAPHPPGREAETAAAEAREPEAAEGAEPTDAAEPSTAEAAEPSAAEGTESEAADGEPGTELSAEDLDAAADELDDGAPPDEADEDAPAGGGREGQERARLLALNLALGGATRDEAERELSEELDVDDLDEILDEAYGDAR